MLNIDKQDERDGSCTVLIQGLITVGMMSQTF